MVIVKAVGYLTVAVGYHSYCSKANFCKANTSPEFGVAYLRQVLPKWKKLKAGVEGHGSPVLLVICPSALRALEEQQKFLKKSTCHMGIGTPSRILALIKSGHLGLDQLCAVVIDWNWRDVKHHRLVDAPELRTELANLLKTYIIPHIKSHSKCKIGIL
ncbi:CMS1-like protein [Mya arenaria]|uniref:CMS1-like protein n=1 Tax=Mya arenaria TaxID=6604 RepID=A0ABY7EEF1_MYAAR|nr:CMS1-like protein [Mya arenaria]